MNKMPLQDSPKQSSGWLYFIIIHLARAFFRLFYRHRVYGQEHISPGPAIIAANHLSFLDPPLVSISVPGEVFFLARKTLFKPKWFGRFIWALNARPISGDVKDIQVFREIESLLEKGGKVILFPEGTRSLSGEIGRMKGGITLLVALTKCNVIPTFAVGSGEIWGKNRKLPKLWGRTACVFGSALRWENYEHLEKKEAQQRFAEDLRDAIVGLKNWYEKGAQGSPP